MARMHAIPLREDEAYYPDSDGEPAAESPVHLEEMVYVWEVLDERFEDDPNVFVGANMFLFYRKGDPRAWWRRMASSSKASEAPQRRAAPQVHALARGRPSPLLHPRDDIRKHRRKGQGQAEDLRATRRRRVLSVRSVRRILEPATAGL